MSTPNWEVIERQRGAKQFWDVTNEFWVFTFAVESKAVEFSEALNRTPQRTGDAAKSLIACAADALAFVEGGSGPAHRKGVTHSLRGTVSNARRLLGDSG